VVRELRRRRVRLCQHLQDLAVQAAGKPGTDVVSDCHPGELMPEAHHVALPQQQPDCFAGVDACLRLRLKP